MLKLLALCGGLLAVAFATQPQGGSEMTMLDDEAALMALLSVEQEKPVVLTQQDLGIDLEDLIPSRTTIGLACALPLSRGDLQLVCAIDPILLRDLGFPAGVEPQRIVSLLLTSAAGDEAAERLRRATNGEIFGIGDVMEAMLSELSAETPGAIVMTAAQDPQLNALTKVVLFNDDNNLVKSAVDLPDFGSVVVPDLLGDSSPGLSELPDLGAAEDMPSIGPCKFATMNDVKMIACTPDPQDPTAIMALIDVVDEQKMLTVTDAAVLSPEDALQTVIGMDAGALGEPAVNVLAEASDEKDLMAMQLSMEQALLVEEVEVDTMLGEQTTDEAAEDVKIGEHHDRFRSRFFGRQPSFRRFGRRYFPGRFMRFPHHDFSYPHHRFFRRRGYFRRHPFRMFRRFGGFYPLRRTLRHRFRFSEDAAATQLPLPIKNVRDADQLRRILDGQLSEQDLVKLLNGVTNGATKAAKTLGKDIVKGTKSAGRSIKNFFGFSEETPSNELRNMDNNNKVGRVPSSGLSFVRFGPVAAYPRFTFGPFARFPLVRAVPTAHELSVLPTPVLRSLAHLDRMDNACFPGFITAQPMVVCTIEQGNGQTVIMAIVSSESVAALSGFLDERTPVMPVNDAIDAFVLGADNVFQPRN